MAEVDRLEDSTLGDVIWPTTTDVVVKASTSTANLSVFLMVTSRRLRLLPIPHPGHADRTRALGQNPAASPRRGVTFAL
ncbi:MAG TPA: hypothetical protein DEF45_03790 [Rhodopirellula sp.]|nr:hypothetical protein [Rhodopirellula sp.]